MSDQRMSSGFKPTYFMESFNQGLASLESGVAPVGSAPVGKASEFDLSFKLQRHKKRFTHTDGTD